MQQQQPSRRLLNPPVNKIKRCPRRLNFIMSQQEDGAWARGGAVRGRGSWLMPGPRR